MFLLLHHVYDFMNVYICSSCLREFVNDITESVRCLFQQNNAIYNKAKVNHLLQL